MRRTSMYLPTRLHYLHRVHGFCSNSKNNLQAPWHFIPALVRITPKPQSSGRILVTSLQRRLYFMFTLNAARDVLHPIFVGLPQSHHQELQNHSFNTRRHEVSAPLEVPYQISFLPPNKFSFADYLHARRLVDLNLTSWDSLTLSKL